MKKAIVVGGSNGIGLAIATCLAEEYDVVVVDKSEPDASIASRVVFEPLDLTSGDYSVFDRHQDAEVVMITAGFGRLALFEDIDESLIDTYFQVNTLPVMHIVKRYYQQLLHRDGFRLGVMVSIAGYMSSPFFSLQMTANDMNGLPPFWPSTRTASLARFPMISILCMVFGIKD